MGWFRSADVFTPDVHRGWLPWGVLAPFLAFVFVVAAVLAGTRVLEPVVPFDAKGNPLGVPALAAFLLVPFGILMALVLAWIAFVERRRMASIGWSADRKLRRFLVGHAVGSASVLGVVIVIWVAGGYRATTFADALGSGHALLSVVMLLVAFALQASVEELVFRGWLLSVLAKKFNVATGVVLSSAVFALLHFSRGQPALVSLSNMMFGVFACCWALRSRSILGVMGWHAGWNWLLAVGFTLPVTGLVTGVPALLVGLDPVGPGWLTGGPQGPEGSIVTVIYFAAACSGLVWTRSAQPVAN